VSAIPVQFKRLRGKEAPVTITMEAVPRKGDIILWEYTDPDASRIPVGHYMVESVAWVVGNTQRVLVLLVTL
jgi:hypothetical protein